jgi:hypothetical protein
MKWTIKKHPENESAWWYAYPSEKYKFVSSDDDFRNMMGKSFKIPWFQTTNQ